MKKNNMLKISRGYRLKRSTHKLIKSLEAITECDTDTIIERSCRLYLKSIELKEENNNENHNQNKIINFK